MKCAAFELPFGVTEQFGRHDVREILAVLAEQGIVHRTGGEDADQSGADGGWAWTSESYPAAAVSLRSISSDNFVVVDTTGQPQVIGETDFTSGPATLHPKAIYMVEGRLYQVERLDFEGRKAYVREVDCDYYTNAITSSRVMILDTFVDGSQLPDFGSHGEVHVVSRVVGFKKIKFYTNENVGSGELDLPEQQMHTTSYWLTIPAHVMCLLPFATDDRRDGIVGLSFAIQQMAQLLLMCDRHDIGISLDVEQQSPRIFVYDNYPGGIGFSDPLHRMQHELLEGTRRLIAECSCESGCPGCVGPVGNTGPLAKSAALRILDLLLSGELART